MIKAKCAFFLAFCGCLCACNGNNIEVADGSQPSGTQTIVVGNGSSMAGGSGAQTTAVDGLRVFHRSGQTFIVWNETASADGYHVYRHTQPITGDNLNRAQKLTLRWGALDNRTSENQYSTGADGNYFVIRDLAAPLRDTDGLFVHTTEAGQSGAAYYAVTTVVGGIESSAVFSGRSSLATPVSEAVGRPAPVLVKSVNGGNGRVYVQYMDYAQWNPTFNGYAYHYSVALPAGYNASRSYPLQVQLHAYDTPYTFLPESEFGWQVIQLFPHDPGPTQGSTNSWWYGYAADHDYLTGGAPASGVIENFTEQRVLRAVDEVIANTDFSVNTDLVHAFGHSMGASGALALGMRYPSVFAGIYASEPMTNYRSSPVFQDEFSRLWGTRNTNLGTRNRGPRGEAIAGYTSGVWDWMNHQQQLQARRGDEFAFLIVDHGKADRTIDWSTQGRPMVAALTQARAGFTATALEGVGHTWLSFSGAATRMVGLGFGGQAEWRYPRSLSFPAFSNASGSSAPSANQGGDLKHNTDLEWSAARNTFHQAIVETANRYEISIRSLTVDQTVDITPRRLRALRLSPGMRCNWQATDIAAGAVIGNGAANVDADRLLTLTNVPVRQGAGSRLVVDC